MFLCVLNALVQYRQMWLRSRKLWLLMSFSHLPLPNNFSKIVRDKRLRIISRAAIGHI